VSKLLIVPLLAAAVVAALNPVAGKASAYCDAADCLPNVTRNVAQGAPCVPRSEYDFGLDAENRTFVCATSGVWQSAGRLVGLRDVGLPCDAVNDSAQDPNGIPLICARLNPVTLRWNHRVDTPGPTRCFSAALGCPFREP
jgi:hypothetical protein